MMFSYFFLLHVYSSFLLSLNVEHTHTPRQQQQQQQSKRKRFVVWLLNSYFQNEPEIERKKYTKIEQRKCSTNYLRTFSFHSELLTDQSKIRIHFCTIDSFVLNMGTKHSFRNYYIFKQRKWQLIQREKCF